MPWFLAVLIVLVVVALDWGTKYYVETNLAVGQSISVIDEVFHFTYVLNKGAAFGILENQTIFFVITAFLVLGISIYFFSCVSKEERLLRLGISLLSGGAAGNLIDRMKTGMVVDFFDFRVWPVFNIADIAIVAGVALIIFAILFLSPKGKVEET